MVPDAAVRARVPLASPATHREPCQEGVADEDNSRLRRTRVHPRQLLDAAVEEHEVVHQLDQARLGTDLEQVLVELEARTCSARSRAWTES
jgi:hypothetical protein